MAKKSKEIKIPSNFKKLTDKPVDKRTGENKKSDFLKLFSDKKLKKNIPPEKLLKAASLLADGFSAKKYTGKIKKKKVKDARRALQDFYDFSALHGKVRYVRPKKENRKLFANELGISPRFKVYPMPVFGDNDKYKIIRKTTKKGRKKTVTKKLKLKGDFLDTELFEFPNRKAAAKNPEREIKKLLKEIDKKYGKKTRDLKIKCGEWLSHFTTDWKDEPKDQGEIIEDEITLYF